MRANASTRLTCERDPISSMTTTASGIVRGEVGEHDPSSGSSTSVSISRSSSAGRSRRRRAASVPSGPQWPSAETTVRSVEMARQLPRPRGVERAPRRSRFPRRRCSDEQCAHESGDPFREAFDARFVLGGGIERFRAPACGLAHPSCRPAVADHVDECRRQGGGIFGWNEPAGHAVVDELFRAAGPRGHHRPARGHRLDHDPSEPFRTRRQAEAPGTIEQAPDLGSRNRRAHRDALRRAPGA